MNSVIEDLYGLLAKELETLDKIVEKNQNPVLFIELIRCIDSSFLFSYEGKEKYEPFIQLGYGRCLEAFYKPVLSGKIICFFLLQFQKFRIGALTCFYVMADVRWY